MMSEIKRLGALLEKLVDGVITEPETRFLIKRLEELEHDTAQPSGIRMAAVMILAAIDSELIHAR